MPLKLLVPILLLATCACAQPGWVQTQSTSTPVSGSSISYVMTGTTAGNCLGVFVSDGNGATPTLTGVSDGTHSYTYVADQNNAEGDHIWAYVGPTYSGGDITLTATFSGGSASYARFMVTEVSGATAACTVSSHNSNYYDTGSSPHTTASMSVTVPSAGGVLLLSTIVDHGSAAFTAGTNFTIPATTGARNTLGVSNAVEYYAVASGGSQSGDITITWSGGTQDSTILFEIDGLPTYDYTCTGPSSGYDGQVSTNFTCTKTSGTWGSGNTVTISDGSHGGTITPSVGSGGTSPVTTGNLNGLSSFTYTYTPVVVTTITLSYTDNYSGIDSVPDSYAVSPLVLAFSGCPSSSHVNVASSICTVTLSGGAFNGSMTVTVADGSQGGLVTPSVGSPGTAPLTVTPANSATSFTFTYTPASIGVKTISLSNNFNGTNPSSFGYMSNPWQLSFSGCSSGNLRVASSTCTVTLTGATFDGTHTVTLSDGGNLGTFTHGTSGNPLTVTPTNGASSFTYTYTPYLIGKKSITGTANTTNWSAPTPFIYTSSSTDVSTFIAKADGNWASAGTWNCTSGGCGHTTPDTGDTVVITGYHVTVPVSTTAYIGTCPANSTTYDLQISDNAGVASGWLEVAGTLWVCGNSSLTAGTHSLGDNPTTWPILQLDTGAELDIDQNQNASVSYRVVSSAAEGWGKLYSGTAGDTCAFVTGLCPTKVKGVNLGAVNPVLYDATSLADTILLRIYGTLITDCGSASKGCIESLGQQDSAANAYADAGVVDLQGNIFLRTGGFQGSMSVISTPTVINNRFLADLKGTTFASSVSYPMTKTCTIRGNYFAGEVDYNYNDEFPNCDITGNLFHDVDTYCCGSVLAKSFTRNVLLIGPDTANAIYPASPVGNVLISTQNHMIFVQAGTNTTWNLSDNICFNPGSPAESHCLGSQTPYTAATTFKMLRNLSIPAAGNGAESGDWMGGGPNGADWEMIYFDHNGLFGIPYYAWSIFLGHSGPYFPDNTPLQSYRSNLHWAPSASTMNIAVGNLDFADLASAPGNSTNTANLGWNGFHNAAASANFTTALNNPNCKPSAYLGTPYDICEATKASPDNTLSDVTADPKMIDRTRTPFTWAASLHSQAATQAGMEAALSACQDEAWCIEEMRTWIARGFQPTNLALKGKAHDGSIVGVTGTYGSGYTGSCTVAFTPRDAADLGVGAAATCSFVGGVPVIRITNPGANYRISTPAAVTIGGTCTGGCVAAILAPIISPHDIGPVQMALIPGAM